MTSAADEEERRLAAAGPRRGVRERVHAATLELLHETSYRALTVEAIATRAGASKATLYRWWPSKAAIVADALIEHVAIPDYETRGDVRTDLLELAEHISAQLEHSTLGQVVGTIAWELLRDGGGEAFRRDFHGPPRVRLRAVLAQAIERGELPPGADLDLILDACAGALHYRAVFSEQPIDRAYIERLVDLLIAGARAGA